MAGVVDLDRRVAGVLPDAVPLADAAFSIARAALWVAAIAQGDLGLLREASRDRVHQPGRLAARPDSASVLEHLLGDTAVLAAWLSGSGPTVAALVPAVMDTTGSSTDCRRRADPSARRRRRRRAGAATPNTDLVGQESCQGDARVARGPDRAVPNEEHR